MRYMNVKTGAIVDSPFKIIGKNWELVEKEMVEQTVEVQEETPEEDFVEEEIDLKELTNKQLEDLAKEQGIELTTEDKKNKETRIAAIVAGLE